MKKRKTFYDLEAVLTSGVLCENLDYKPFRAREALTLVRKLGRPLTEEEEKQFEIE